MTAAGDGPGEGRRLLEDLYELAKPRLTLLVAFTAGVGFVLARLGQRGFTPLGPGVSSWAGLLHVLSAVVLASAGSAALNQYLERDHDLEMKRTRSRPLPAGRLSPDQVLLYGTGFCILGVLQATFFLCTLAGFLTALSVAVYVFLYTPLKRRTTLNTLVGAVTGALPPMIGWVAVTGELRPGAWVLFAILFVWQLPHFLSIAWIYREEYGRAGMRMLSVGDRGGEVTMRQIVLFLLTMLPVSLLPWLHHMAGQVYFYGALALGLVFLGVGVYLYLRRTPEATRLLFRASLAYLPLLLGFMILDRVLKA